MYITLSTHKRKKPFASAGLQYILGGTQRREANPEQLKSLMFFPPPCNMFVLKSIELGFFAPSGDSTR